MSELEEKSFTPLGEEQKTEPVEEQKQTENNLPVFKAKEQNSLISNITQQTEFSKTLDKANIEILKEASAEDKKFVDDLKKEVKEAALKSAQLEKDKQELERKYIELQQNYIDTKNELEKQIQNENKWTNREKRRQYHYNGLKDIMEFVHINNPMCIPLMYLIAFIVSPIYLIWTLILCPLGTLIGGTKDNNRPRLVKGAIYTILCLALVIALAFSVYAVMHFVFRWF